MCLRNASWIAGSSPGNDWVESCVIRAPGTSFFDLNQGRFCSLCNESDHPYSALTNTRYSHVEAKARLMTAAVIAIALPVYTGVGAAAPISGTLAIQECSAEQCPGCPLLRRWLAGGGWRGGGWGRGWGWGGVGAGLAAGAIIGGALAAPYYYGGGYYGGGPYYANPYYAKGPGYNDDEVRRWRCSRVLHATLPVIRSAQRNLHGQRRISASLSVKKYRKRTKTPAPRRGFLFNAVIRLCESHSQNLQGGKSRL